MQPLYFVQNQQKGAQNFSALLLFLRNGGLPCDNIRPERPVSSRLRRQNPGLWAEVQAVVQKNKAERHLRGGEATRRKYLREPSCTAPHGTV